MLILSPASQDSYWVNKELSYAISLRNEILPIQIEDFPIARRLRFQLADVQIRNYCNDCQGVLREVISLFPKVTPTTPAHVPAPTPKPAPAAPAPNPVQDEMTAEEYYQKGKNAYKSQQYADTVSWLRKAADLGHAAAQTALGYCYEMGDGVTKNLVEAVNWYRKAADQGLADAQLNLGYCYDMGNGVEKDMHEAVKLYRMAAEQGNAIAQYNLGNCYRGGRGVAVDLAEAKKWYQKAADQGYENAKLVLASLK